MSYGDDQHKFQHVPKIILVILERIQDVKLKKNLSNMNIYKSLNGSSDWDDNFENQIVELKMNMNRGNWNFINEIDNINILIEIFYDWLEDCVHHLIDPNKVIKIYQDNSEIISILKYNLSQPKNFTPEKRKTITNYIKNELKMIEFETATCIADFLSNLQPNDDEEKEQYFLMKEKMSIYSLGFNFDLIFENKNSIESQNCWRVVDKLMDILNYLVLVINVDLQDNPSNSFYIADQFGSSQNIENMSLYLKRKKLTEIKAFRGSSNSLVQSITKDGDLANYFSKIKNFSSEKNLLQFRYSRPNFNTSKIGNISDFIKPKIISGDSETFRTENLNPNEKDEMLFMMYKSLHKYFDEKPSDLENKIPDANKNLNSDNFVMINDFYDSFHKFMLDSNINRNSHNIGISNTSSNSRKEDPEEKIKLNLLDVISEDRILEENKSNFLSPNEKIILNNHLQIVQPKLTDIISKKQSLKSDLCESDYKSDSHTNASNKVDLKVNTDRNSYSYIRPKNRRRTTKKSKYFNHFNKDYKEVLMPEPEK